MGVGFDRGDSAITPPYLAPATNVNPFINVNQPPSTYSQGYRHQFRRPLGLTNALTANYAFVKLLPNAAAAGQQSAAWVQAPMTITVGGATGSGQVLPDSGISYAFLTPPTGANISTSACANPPGGNGCANPGLPIQVYLPGQTTPQLAFYNFTTINGGTPSNPLTPESCSSCPAAPCSSTPAASSTRVQLLLRSGERLRWLSMGQQPGRRRYGSVTPMVALQGNVSLPSLNSTLPPT